MTDHPDPEFNLIRLSIQGDTSEAHRQRVVAALQQEIDWSRTLNLANRHAVLLLLLRRLNQMETADVPPGVLVQLKRLFARLTVFKEQVVRETGYLLDRMTEQGIEVLVIKGAPLAYLAHGDIKWRIFADTDWLVSPRQFEQAEQVLRNEGYAALYDTWRRKHIKRPYLWLKGEWTYRKQGHVLDLHRRFLPRRYLSAWNFDDLNARAQTVTINGVAMRTLSVEDTLLHVCYHGEENAWRLQYVADLAELVRHQEIDWERLEAIARYTRGANMLEMGLLLAWKLLEAPLPPDLRSQLHQSALHDLADRYVQAMPAYQCSGERPGVSPWQRLAMQDTLYTRLRFAGTVVLKHIYDGLRDLVGRKQLSA